MFYKDFIEMPVWQLAIEIVGDVYELRQKLPKCEDYALRGQLREAAVSIAGILQKVSDEDTQKIK